MITLKEWMEIADYRITEGGDYCWSCYGPKAYQLSSWNGEQDGFSFSIVFDTFDQTVYEVEVCDYANNRAYRMINPVVRNEYDNEVESRDINLNQAWDDVNWIDLEVDDDFISKCLSIKAGEVYDTQVSVPLTLDDNDMFELMKLAHERNITLNQLVEDILRQAVEERIII